MRRRVAALARRHWVLLAVLATHALVWGLADTVISPHPDYLDHWMQSRILAWGYYEHPPMIAWVLRAFTTVLGQSEAALEAIAIILNVGILAGIYGIACQAFDRRSAVFCLLAMEATPYFVGGTPLVHIDQPLLLFWLAALSCLLAYQRTGRARWLLAMGVFAGLGALSKYTMVLFYLGALAFILLVPARRRELRNPFVYLAGLVSLAIFSPVLIWNAQHHWVSILYQLSKGEGGGEFPGKHLIEFSLGWIVLFSVFWVGPGFTWLYRRWRREGLHDDGSSLLLLMALTPIAFFSLAMIPGSFPDPQYVNVGFLSFFPLLGRELSGRWGASGHRGVLRLFGGAFALNALLLGIFAAQTYHPFLGVRASRDFTQQIVGWHETGQQVEALLREQQLALPQYVISFQYPLAAQFSLHLSTRPRTYSLERPLRNEWTNPADITPQNTIIVCQGEECGWMHELIGRQFDHAIVPVGTVNTVLWGVPRHTVSVYRMDPAPLIPNPWRKPSPG